MCRVWRCVQGEFESVAGVPPPLPVPIPDPASATLHSHDPALYSCLPSTPHLPARCRWDRQGHHPTDYRGHQNSGLHQRSIVNEMVSISALTAHLGIVYWWEVIKS